MKKIKNKNFINLILVYLLMMLISDILLSQQGSNIQGIIFRDNFKDVSEWKLYKDKGAELEVSSSKDGTVPVLKINYNLGTKEWVAVERPVSLNLNDSSVVKFKVLALGNKNYLEIKFVDKDGSVFGNKMILSTEGWQNVVVNLADFEYWWGGDDKLDDVVKIGFAISKKTGGQGIVEISDLEIVQGAKKTRKLLPPDVLDDFETNKRWMIFTSENAQLVLKNLPGKERNSLVAEYDLGKEEGRWVAFEKRYKLDLLENNMISFWVKSEGENNTLEFKIIDVDGSVFGKKFEDLSNQWKEIKIPMNDLEYWWAGDDKLTKPVKICFAISVINGGKGKIWLDNLRLTK
jgi:hypothetical protein